MKYDNRLYVLCNSGNSLGARCVFVLHIRLHCLQACERLNYDGQNNRTNDRTQSKLIHAHVCVFIWMSIHIHEENRRVHKIQHSNWNNIKHMYLPLNNKSPYKIEYAVLCALACVCMVCYMCVFHMFMCGAKTKTRVYMSSRTHFYSFTRWTRRSNGIHKVHAIVCIHIYIGTIRCATSAI